MDVAEGNKTILIIEDDAETRRVLHAALAYEGHRILEAEKAAIGLNIFRKEQPHLVVLDLKLPDGSGFDVCKAIRSHKTLFATPVVMLTGQEGMESKISGFTAGADQYLVKPVHIREFMLWVAALLRRLSLDASEGPKMQVGDLTIDLTAHLVSYKSQRVPDLTGKEFDLLYFLVKKRPQVLSRKHILSNLWHTIAVDHVVDTHMSNLRRKLPREVSDRIQNIPGKGFRFLE